MLEKTFYEYLEARAHRAGDKPAFRFLADGEGEASSLGYGQLLERTASISRELQVRFRKGTRALLIYSPGLEFVQALLGCMASGLIAVPISLNRRVVNKAYLERLVRDAGPELILTETSLVSRVRGSIPGDFPGIAVIDSMEINGASSGPHRPVPISPEDIAILQYTSGSTSFPKGVCVSYGNLMHNQEMMRLAFGQDSDSTIVSWLPFHHDMGLMGTLLHTLHISATAVLMSPTHFVQKPVRWLNAISRFKATGSGGPNFAYELAVKSVSEAERDGLDLRSWRAAFNGAEPVKAATMKAFWESYGKYGFDGRAFQPCYGLAESTLLVTATPSGSGPEVKGFLREEISKGAAVEASGAEDQDGRISRLVCCGIPFGSKVIIADTGGAVLPERQVGEILIQSDSVTKGYWERSQETRELFLEIPGSAGNPHFLRTGDLGFLDGGGLYIVGRVKDMLIFNGRNYYPQDIEWELRETVGALARAELACFDVENGSGNGLVILVESVNTSPEEAERIFREMTKVISESIGLPVWEICLVGKGSIPKTTSGKVRRGESKRRYVQVELTLNASSRKVTAPQAAEDTAGNELEKRIIAFSSRILEYGGAIVPGSNLIEKGLDSIGGLRLASELKQAFRVELALDDILAAPTPKGIAALIESAPKQPWGKDEAIPASTGPFELSPEQEAIWMDQMVKAEGNAYNMALVIPVDPDLSMESVRAGFRILVARHEILRTRFVEAKGRPLQDILPAEALDLGLVHAELPGKDWSESAFEAALKSLAGRKFAMDSWPLCQATSIQGPDIGHCLVFVVHHILLDGASIAFLLRDLLSEIRRHQAGQYPETAHKVLQYKDFSEWRRRYLASESFRKQGEHWRRALGELPPPLELPKSYSMPPSGLTGERTGASAGIRIGEETGRDLTALAAGQGASLYSVLLTGFIVLLRRLTGRDTFLVGIPASLVPEEGFREVPGLYVNPLVFKAEVNAEDTFRSLLERVKRALLSALQNRQYPFVRLLQDYRLSRHSDSLPVIPVFFNGLTFVDSGSGKDVLATFRKQIGLDMAFEWDFYVWKSGDGIEASLDFRAAHYSREAIASILEKYADILDLLGKSPDAAITCRTPAVSPVAGKARQAPLVEWLRPGMHFLEILRSRITAQGARIAIRDVAKVLTYAELDILTDRLAAEIIRSGGKGRNILIAVEHGWKVPVAMVAALKAGKCLVPLEPGFPAKRIEQIAAVTKASAILACEGATDKLAGVDGLVGIPIIRVGSSQTDGFPAGIISSTPDEWEDAYILFTSGSTGAPKGVRQTYAGLSYFTTVYTAAIGLTPEDRLSGFSSCCFDSSLKETLCSLVNGATYCPLDLKQGIGAEALAAWVNENRISVWNSVPTLFRAYAKEWIAAGMNFPALRIIKMAGEMVRAEDYEAFRRISVPGSRYMVGLGSTESSFTAFNLFDHGYANRHASLPVGYPVEGTEVLLLDQNLAEVGPLEVGEAAIGSDFITPGYLESAGGAAPDPFFFLEGRRFLKTGDLARRHEDGRIELLGRKDNQLKINGVRVETSEVEHHLVAYTGVTDAAVLGVNSPDGGKELIAYYISRDALDSRAIRAHLQDRLPAAFVPGRILRLPNLPLTHSGKVDRQALARLEVTPIQTTSEEPAQPLEPAQEKLADILAAALGNGRVGLYDNFFERGGNSILALGVIARIEAAFGVRVELREFLRKPTVRDLSAALGKERLGDRLAIKPLRPAPCYPTTALQRKIWMMSQMPGGSAVNNMFEAIEIPGRIDQAALENGLASLVSRHEAFRTSFGVFDGDIVQAIRETCALPLRFLDLSRTPDARTQAGQWLADFEAKPFDLESPPLARSALIRLPEDKDVFAFCAHHAICDGWSVKIVSEEIIRNLSVTQAQPARASARGALPAGMKEYAAALSAAMLEGSLASESAHWEKLLSDLPEPLAFGEQVPIPGGSPYAGGRIPFDLGEEPLRRLRALAKERGTTFFSCLAAAVLALLHRETGRGKLVLGFPSANRSHPSLQGAVGIFISGLPVVSTWKRGVSFAGFTDAVSASIQDALGASILPIEYAEEGILEAGGSLRSPLFDAMIVLQEKDPARLVFRGGATRRFPVEKSVSKLPLNFGFYDGEATLCGYVDFMDVYIGREAAARLIGKLPEMVSTLAEAGTFPALASREAVPA